MGDSDIYESEPEYRKEYISEWIGEELNITREDTLKSLKKKYKKLSKKDESKLSNKEKDLLSYLDNERNLNYMLKESLKRIKKSLGNEFKDFVLSKDYKEGVFKKISKKKYYILQKQNKKTKYFYGYSKGKKTQVRIEKYFRYGKVQLRYRTKKGKLASIVKKGFDNE